MDVFSKYFRRLLSGNAAQIFPNITKPVENAGNYPLLVQEVNKVAIGASDLEQAQRIADTIDSSVTSETSSNGNNAAGATSATTTTTTSTTTTSTSTNAGGAQNVNAPAGSAPGTVSSSSVSSTGTGTASAAAGGNTSQSGAGGDVFREFDLATFIEHFRLDPIAKMALVLAFRNVGRADLRSKGMSSFFSFSCVCVRILCLLLARNLRCHAGATRSSMVMEILFFFDTLVSHDSVANV